MTEAQIAKIVSAILAKDSKAVTVKASKASADAYRKALHKIADSGDLHTDRRGRVFFSVGDKPYAVGADSLSIRVFHGKR